MRLIIVFLMLSSAVVAQTNSVTYANFGVPNRPLGAVFDGANIWVGNDDGSGNVTKLRASDAAVLGTFNVAGQQAVGVFAFDGANIWATTGKNPGSAIKIRASDGTVLGSFPAGNTPVAGTFDGANIWVPNYVSNNITKLRASDGTVLGTFPAGNTPSGAAFDGANIWVSNTEVSNSVTKLNVSNGQVLGAFPVGNSPYGLIFDGANIWVANGGSNNVTKLLASDGAVLGTFPAGGSPLNVVFDGSNVWVTDYQGNTVTELRAIDGGILGTFPVGVHPNGIAFDGTNIWVANTGSNTVTKLSVSPANAQPTPVLPGYSVSLVVSGLSGPSGILYRPATNDLLVCEQNANNVSRIDLVTGLVSPFGPVAAPEHIAADSMGNVYITTDNDGGPVTVLASTGTAVATFPVPGHPDGIALDANDNLFLANNGTKVIAEYAAGSFTNPTTFAGGFQSLQGITFDTSGRLFAEDYIAGIVYYVTSSGNTVWATGLGSFNESMLDIAYDQFPASLLVSGYTEVVSQIPSMGIVNTFATGFSVPAGIAIDTNQNIYVAEAATGKVWKFTAVSPLPSINSGGVVNAASYAAPVAAGSIAAAYGNFLLSSPSTSSMLPLPTNLSGLSMQFGGFGSPGVPVPLFYASGGQVNLQVPWELAGQAQTPLTVSMSSQTSAPQVVNLAPFAPGIFSMNSQGTGQGAILDTSYRLVGASNPATAGTTYIQIYCTGLGAVTNQPSSGSPAPGSPLLAETTTVPTVSIGNVSGEAIFSGLAPGYVGLYQVNALVPAGTPGGAAVPVTISIGGVTSNTVTIAVE
jgi:uncharacterized protein (TIGR03437 family)